MIDLLRANSTGFACIAVAIVLLIVAHALVWAFPVIDNEDLDLRRAGLRIARWIFGVVLVAYIAIVAINQTANVLPRNTEDRTSTENDQKRFEKRIENATKAKKGE